METLDAIDSSGGVNTREEPRALKKNECISLVNLFPGDPSPKPRPGCSFWGRGSDATSPGRTGNLVAVLPFKRGAGNIAIEVFVDKVLAVPATGTSYQIEDASGTPIDGCLSFALVCHQRVDDALFANSDDPDWRWVFEEVAGRIVARRPWIELPSSFRAAISTGTVTGSLTPGKFYRYGFTFVNRGDSVGVERRDQYAPGLLESVEDSSKRITVEAAGTSFALTLTFNDRASPRLIDPQATHIRVYRTDAAISADTVASLSLHWVADLPIPVTESPGTVVQVVEFDDVANVSETDFQPDTTDLDDFPSATVMYYQNGRMWFAGLPGMPTSRAYYSEVFGTTALSPKKSIGSVDLTYSFVKISSDSTERATAIGAANNDLYFTTDQSVAFLQDGDPDNKIKTISSTMGCPFYQTMTEWGQILAWLSPVGPVFAQNGYVDKFVEFKSGEVWPSSYNGKGYFYDKSKVPDRSKVIGFHYLGTWWLVHGRKVVGFYQSEDKRVQGGMEVVFADAEMQMDSVCVVDNETVIFDARVRTAWTSGSRIYPWRFLNEDAKNDCGWYLTISQKARRFYVDVHNPQKVAEPVVLTLFASFTDHGELRFSISGDSFRWRKSFRYLERALSANQQHQDLDARTNQAYKQPIPAVGQRASYFDVGWEKILRPPYDFSCMGISLKIAQRRGIPNDSLSTDQGTDLPIDSGMVMRDTGETIGGNA